MTASEPPIALSHDHIFLGASHSRNERRAWFVIALCGAMMLVEIVGGMIFGSIALVADGLHMSTHAGALLLAALAYRFSRRHIRDERFTFGTGKFGDLAGFASAIVLAMIALLIGYEAVLRFLSPVPIHFREAIPIACLGLAVNVASALLLNVATITWAMFTIMRTVEITSIMMSGMATRIIVTTTCGPPWSMSWLTQRCRCL